MPTVVTPQVFLIGAPSILDANVQEYLNAIGAAEWSSDADDAAMELMEFGGRICYKSFGTELNKNLTRVRGENKAYLQNIISSKHGRILEHVVLNFIIHDVSRVLTHELITHKVGTAQSQESLRFVRLDHLRVYMPTCFVDAGIDGYVLEKFAILESWQREMAEMLDLDHKPFADKKVLTSAMRRLAPMGLCTSLMWTTNLRAIRHIVEQRTSIHAEEEIRVLFDIVGRIVRERYPVIFEDFFVDEYGQWTPIHSKV